MTARRRPDRPQSDIRVRDREIAAIQAVFPDVPVAGFLTYAEIARYRGRLDGWHNTTAVVTAIFA